MDKFGSINTKLTLLILSAVMPCLAILLYSGIELRNHLIKDGHSNVSLMTHNMAVAQEEITKSTKQVLSILAQLPSIQAMDSEACAMVFSTVLEQNPNYSNIALVDLDGHVLASGRPMSGKNLADRKHVKDALEKGDFAVGEYIITRASNATPAFPFAYPVLDRKRNMKAVLTVAVKLEIFSHFYAVSALPEKSFVAVTDYKGIRLYYYPAQSDTNPVGEPIRSGPWNIAAKGDENGNFVNTGSDGLRRIFAYEKVRLTSDTPPYLYVWAGIPEKYILRDANASLIRNVLLLCLATLVSLGFSWIIGRNTLTRPIQNLVALTRKFARGDLEARGELTAHQGEFGLLTRAFNEMAESLKLSSKTLLESETKFRSMMEAMTDPIYICSPNYQVEYMNSAMINRVGYDATGEFCFKCLHDLNEKCSWCQHDSIQQGQSSELEIISPKDNRSYLLSQYPIVRGERAISKMTVYKDVTELRSMEAQLHQAQKMESIGRLAGGVAHDYNNALSAIIGFTELALDSVGPGESLHNDLKEVLKAAERATNITRQLLAFARKQTIAPRILDLNTNVESMLRMLARLIGEDIDLAWLPGAEMKRVQMDPSQLDQILANLCVNARDAISGVGKVTIETKMVTFDTAYCRNHQGFSPGEYIMLAVSDNGCGMEKEILENIFEPFFTTKTPDKGTGLGLAMIYGIVQQNSGFINVYSEPGNGTTVRIYLPSHEGEVVNVQKENQETLLQSRGETILIVEDEDSILKLARQILTGLGYTVLTARTPEAAIPLAEQERNTIHLLLTDVIMPGMNGLELANRLRSCNPKLKFVFMSGYTSNAIAHHGVLDKGVHFVQKPFSKAELAATVRKVLDED